MALKKSSIALPVVDSLKPSVSTKTILPFPLCTRTLTVRAGWMSISRWWFAHAVFWVRQSMNYKLKKLVNYDNDNQRSYLTLPAPIRPNDSASAVSIGEWWRNGLFVHNEWQWISLRTLDWWWVSLETLDCRGCQGSPDDQCTTNRTLPTWCCLNYGMKYIKSRWRVVQKTFHW